ncbi:MAG: hypothetical protein QOJ67_3441 [Acidimicrobiaceae bacterium]|jgi:hypothetical protein
MRARGTETDRWLERGFDADDAARWHAAGFRPDPAYLLRTLGASPAISAQLLRAGLDQEGAVEAVEHAIIRGPGHPPRSSKEVAATLERLVTMTACGFVPAEAAAWIDNGWEAEEAAAWFEVGFGPANARAWRDEGFAPKEALAWKRDLFGSKQASQWRRLGDTPARARAVAATFTSANITVADGLRLMDRGLTAEQVAAQHERPTPELTAAPAPTPPVAPAPPKVAPRPKLEAAFHLVPVTRDDLLAAAGQLVRAGGEPSLVHRLNSAADAGCKEMEPAVISAAITELRRLDEAGALGSPLLVRIVVSRFERALNACLAVSGRMINVDRTPLRLST